MTSKVVFYWSIFLCLLACIGNASAAERQFQHNVNFFTQYADVHFVELDDEGDPFNEEEGSLIFYGLGFYWEFDHGLFSEISYKTANENVTYRGLSQLGLFVESESEYFIRDVQVLLGQNFGTTGVYLGVGNRFRERNILGTDNVLGLYEETDAIYGIFGLRLNLFAGKPFQIRFNGNIATDLQSDLYVASERFDATRFETGKHFVAEGSIEFLFHLFSGVTLRLIPSYEYTHIEKSDNQRAFDGGQYIGDIHHPETEYETTSLTAKLSWYF